jgi:hypothetical protein
MPTAVATPREAPTVSLQGIVVPAASVNPKAFFAATRRLQVAQKTLSTIAGFGATDTISILQTGIISQLQIHVFGTITLTPGTGTIASTAKWPYDVLRAVRFTANGQSNLINVPGSVLKLRDILGRGDLTDRGVSQNIGGASPGTARTQGTLALNSENWGVGSNVTGLGAQTATVDLTFTVPVAFDQVNLLGAIFAQTASTDLVLGLDWAPLTDLFTLTGNATVTQALQVVVEATLYSIPQGPSGIVVPDLSAFHSLITTRTPQVANGVFETRLAGQGVGRSLLRLAFRIFNGGTPPAPGTPLAVTGTSAAGGGNYGQIGWRFGGNDTPELISGQTLRYWNERLFDDDIGAFWGFGVLDFSSENAFRDSVDEGTATELRLVTEVLNTVTLTNPVLEYTQETVFAGATGA